MCWRQKIKKNKISLRWLEIFCFSENRSRLLKGTFFDEEIYTDCRRQWCRQIYFVSDTGILEKSFNQETTLCGACYLFYTLFTHLKSVPGKLLSMGVFEVGLLFKSHLPLLLLRNGEVYLYVSIDFQR